MRGWQGFAVGGLSLTLLDVLVSRRAASQNAAGILTGAGNLARKFISPTVPAFGKPAAPDHVGIAGTAGQGAVAGGNAAMNQLGGKP